MRRSILPLVMVLTWALAAGCGLAGGPEFEQRSGALVQLAPDEVPSALPRCADRFGEIADWPEADGLFGVAGRPDDVVLEQDGELTCWASSQQAYRRADFAELAGVAQVLGGDHHPPADAPLAQPAPPPSDGETAQGEEEGDSNPLPAAPVANEESEDSNPLPALGDSTMESPTGDSNPLPAKYDEDDPRLLMFMISAKSQR